VPQWRGGGQGGERGPEAACATLPSSPWLWKGSKELAGTVVALSPLPEEKIKHDLAKEGKE